MPKLSGLDHLVLTVADIKASVAFYTDILGMQTQSFVVADGSHRTALSFGPHKINLHPAAAPFNPKAQHPLPGSADLCFLSDTLLQDWLDHFAACGAAVLEGPVPRTGACGPIISLYLRDPDGNLIEVSNAV
jgi:catechol 2,3-dioxygenase-like lactoylglutathione lyase family enzyme